MAKRSRLRVHSGKRRRRVIFITALLLGIALACSSFLFKDDVVQFWLGIFTTNTRGDDGSVRGAIYDRNYKELAVSLDRVSVYARIREVESQEETARQLAPLLGSDEDDLLNRLKGDALRVWLAKNISQEQEEAVQALDLPGISLHREYERYYPQKEKGAHFVGFVDDDIGLAGVEYQYNKLLNEYGIVPRPNDTRNTERREEHDDDGPYLVLTIDLKIQSILEKYLAGIVESHHRVRAGVILMDCRTGDIIGSANYPSYDPNRFRDYKKRFLDNNLADPIAIPLSIRQFLRDSAFLRAQYEKDGEILPWSILSATGSLGSQLRLWEKLQFSDSLELDFVTRKNARDDKDRLISTLKQNFETVPEVTTSLHLLTAISRLVNGGESIVPHVVDRFRNKWGEEVYPKALWGQVSGGRSVEKEVSAEIVHLLGSQMEKGPLASGFLESQSLATMVKNGGQEFRRSGILVSLLPVHKPELILLVSVTDQDFSPMGNRNKVRDSLTAPAKKIVVQLMALQEVMKNLSDMMTVEQKEEMNFQQEQTKKEGVEKGVADDLEKRLMIMPDLRGLSLRKSLRMLQDLDLDIRIEGTGRVVAQEPRAGSVIGSTKECRLILERSD